MIEQYVNGPALEPGTINLDKKLQRICTIGAKGTKPGQFCSPCSIAFNREGNLVVVDRLRGTAARLHCFRPDGTHLFSSDSFSIIVEPTMAIAPNGNIFVSLGPKRQILVFNGHTGRLVSKLGLGSQVQEPYGIAVNCDGTIIVADDKASKTGLLLLDSNGAFKKVLPLVYCNPDLQIEADPSNRGVQRIAAVAGSDQFAIHDSYGRIVFYNSSGKSVRTLELQDTTNHIIYFAIDSARNIVVSNHLIGTYVINTRNERQELILPHREEPFGVAIDHQGRVFVCEKSTCCISVWE